MNGNEIEVDSSQIYLKFTVETMNSTIDTQKMSKFLKFFQFFRAKRHYCFKHVHIKMAQTWYKHFNAEHYLEL